MTWRALLWDVDGTLIDTTNLVVSGLAHVTEAFLGVREEAGFLRSIVGVPLAEQVRLLAGRAGREADFEAMERGFIDFWERNRSLEKTVPLAVEALAVAMTAGLKNALVTSKNRIEVDNTLPRVGILPFVDTVVCRDDVALPKPAPDSCRLAIERLRIGAEEALFIGDSVYDMRCARACGVATCAVLWGAGTREAMLGERPDLVCEAPSALRSLLGL